MKPILLMGLNKILQKTKINKMESIIFKQIKLINFQKMKEIVWRIKILLKNRIINILII